MKTSINPSSSGNDENAATTRLKTGRRVEHRRKWRRASRVLPFVGLVSPLWFLMRVIPKPSRATYPCQRAAFPIASAFVVWLTAVVVSSLSYCTAKRLAEQGRYLVAGLFVVVAAVLATFWWSPSITGARADFVPSDPPNSPVGVGKGIYPGRVAWVHDPNATKWDGVTGHWWDAQNLDQQAVDKMLSQALRTLTAEQNDAAAWDALFRYFNRTHGAGDVGYQPGEKIAIKINLNEEGYGPAYGGNGRMPSPQMIHSLLAQLFDRVHVSGSNVTIYDASRAIADPLYNRIHGDADPNFQNVRFVANTTRNGRIGAVYDPAWRELAQMVPDALRTQSWRALFRFSACHVSQMLENVQMTKEPERHPMEMQFGRHLLGGSDARRRRCPCPLFAGAFLFGALVCGTAALQPSLQGASSSRPLDAEQLYNLTSAWTVHLKFAPAQWEAMEPKGGRNPFGGGPRGSGPGVRQGGPESSGGVRTLAPVFMSQGDLDRDGRVSSEESASLGQKWFKAWDTNGAGKLDGGQIRAGLDQIRNPAGGRIATMLLAPEGKRNGISSALGTESEFVHADLEFEDRLLTNVAVRYKGNGTFMESRDSLKRPLKVDLDKYAKDQSMGGAKSLTFSNNAHQDPQLKNAT